MDVRDVVSVYADLMMAYINHQDVWPGEVWNIGGDDLRTIDYYLQSMLEIFGVEADLQVDDKLYRKFDIPVQHPDSTKVRNLLGWNPKYDIIQTLTDLVQYWLERV
jgi:nucleoside-diphosphate-sugar epimerase